MFLLLGLIAVLLKNAKIIQDAIIFAFDKRPEKAHVFMSISWFVAGLFGMYVLTLKMRDY